MTIFDIMDWIFNVSYRYGVNVKSQVRSVDLEKWLLLLMKEKRLEIFAKIISNFKVIGGTIIKGRGKSKWNKL